MIKNGAVINLISKRVLIAAILSNLSESLRDLLKLVLLTVRCPESEAARVNLVDLSNDCNCLPFHTFHKASIDEWVWFPRHLQLDVCHIRDFV